MQENQCFNVSPLLLSPRHHHKQIVLRFPRNFWDISSHMVHTPLSKPPFESSTVHASVSTLSFFSASNVLFYTGHKHILEVCILSANRSALMLCVSTNDRGVGVVTQSGYVTY